MSHGFDDDKVEPFTSANMMFDSSVNSSSKKSSDMMPADFSPSKVFGFDIDAGISSPEKIGKIS